MHIKILSIVLLAIMTFGINSQSVAETQYSTGLFTYAQSTYCAETSSEEKKDNEEVKQEEEEPDCD